MDIIGHHWRVEDRSDLREIRAVIGELLREEATISPRDRDRVLLIATELGSILSKYNTPHPELILQYYRSDSLRYLDLLSFDHGPGMDEAPLLMHDHVSTEEDLGEGLGGIRRLSDGFGIHSSPDDGTVVFSRTVLHPLNGDDAPLGPYRFGACFRPMPGETASGDRWSVCFGLDGTGFLLMDGLGHGPEASRASLQALSTFERGGRDPLPDLMERIHRELEGTRGGVVSAGRLDPEREELGYVSIGNIQGRLYDEDGTARRIGSQNGIVGRNIPPPMPMSYECGPPGFVLCHTDGVEHNWEFPSRIDVTTAPLGLLAGILLRDGARDHDDVGVLVLGIRPD